MSRYMELMNPDVMWFRRYVTELSERAVRELEEIGGDNEFLKELVIWLINRDK